MSFYIFLTSLYDTYLIFVRRPQVLMYRSGPLQLDIVLFFNDVLSLLICCVYVVLDDIKHLLLYFKTKTV